MPVPAQQRDTKAFFYSYCQASASQKTNEKPRKYWRQNRHPTGQFQRGHRDPSTVEQGSQLRRESHIVAHLGVKPLFGDDELRAYLLYPTQWVLAVLQSASVMFSTPGPALTSRLLQLPALAVSGGSRSSTALKLAKDVVSADCERGWSLIPTSSHYYYYYYFYYRTVGSYTRIYSNSYLYPSPFGTNCFIVALRQAAIVSVRLWPPNAAVFGSFWPQISIRLLGPGGRSLAYDFPPKPPTKRSVSPPCKLPGC